MTGIETVVVDGADPVGRGHRLGSGDRSDFVTALGIYESLFAAGGLARADVEAIATGTRVALEDWALDLAVEIDSYAEAVGVEPWRLHALNARTEILAATGARLAGECSTIVQTRPAVIGAQTWDWYAELAQAWHVVEHRGVDLPFVTLTERGMVGKIGMNAAGVGLTFNILGHASDAVGRGVPVHAVARRVLDTATDIDQAVEIVTGAPLQTSSCLTVLSPEGAVCLEATPAGVGRVEAEGDWVVHTNHFLDADLVDGDMRRGPEPDSLARLWVLRQRVSQIAVQASRDSLVGALCAHEDGQGAPVCCHPPAGAALGTAWQTLATVVLEPTALAARGARLAVRGRSRQLVQPHEQHALTLSTSISRQGARSSSIREKQSGRAWVTSLPAVSGRLLVAPGFAIVTHPTQSPRAPSGSQ